MKTKKIPLRKCLATNKMFPKNDLLRVVRTTDNEVIVDVSGKINGRGAYISKSIEALEIAKKTRCLEKALETSINDAVYERIYKLVK